MGAFPGSNGPIAYAIRADCPNVYKIGLDGTGKTKLTTGCPEIAENPSWNPDGSKLALVARSRGSASKLATLPASGGNLSFVATTGVSPVMDPSFNNDSSTIVFGGGGPGSFSKDIYTVAATGGTPTSLTNASGSEVNGEPEFSPDGTKIAWARATNQVLDVWVMNADGSNPMNLTAGSTGNQNWPSWAPDGSKIAFASDQSGDYEIFTVAADGSGTLEQITDETATNDIQPAYSPDGSLIAFTRGCTADGCSNGPGVQDNGAIYTTDLDGTETLVVDSAKPEFDPSWGDVCVTDCGPVHVTRRITFKFKGTLKLQGTLTELSNEHPECERGQKITIQKNDFAWSTLKRVTTSSTGSFAATIPNRSGSYRAKVQKNDRSATDSVICDAVSETKKYTIRHGRRFIRFLMQSDPDHGGMSALFDIESLDRFDDCVVHVLVKVQRRSGSRWVTIAKVKTSDGYYAYTGGNLIEHMPAHAGTYRAIAPRFKFHGGDHDGDICKQAMSENSQYP